MASMKWEQLPEKQVTLHSSWLCGEKRAARATGSQHRVSISSKLVNTSSKLVNKLVNISSKLDNTSSKLINKLVNSSRKLVNTSSKLVNISSKPSW